MCPSFHRPTPARSIVHLSPKGSAVSERKTNKTKKAGLSKLPQFAKPSRARLERNTNIHSKDFEAFPSAPRSRLPRRCPTISHLLPKSANAHYHLQRAACCPAVVPASTSRSPLATTATTLHHSTSTILLNAVSCVPGAVVRSVEYLYHATQYVRPNLHQQHYVDLVVAEVLAKTYVTDSTAGNGATLFGANVLITCTAANSRVFLELARSVSDAWWPLAWPRPKLSGLSHSKTATE